METQKEVQLALFVKEAVAPTHSKFLVEIIELMTKRVDSRNVRGRSRSRPSLLESGLGRGELVAKSLELVGVRLDVGSGFGEVLLVS